VLVHDLGGGAGQAEILLGALVSFFLPEDVLRTISTLPSRLCSVLKHCSVVEYSDVADSVYATICSEKDNCYGQSRSALLP